MLSLDIKELNRRVGQRHTPVMVLSVEIKLQEGFLQWLKSCVQESLIHQENIALNQKLNLCNKRILNSEKVLSKFTSLEH